MSFLADDNRSSVAEASSAPRNSTAWVEEALFGHRLWARQTPWLLFLEFLNVAQAFHSSDPEQAFAPLPPDRMHSFALRFRIGLRSVLFHNSEMERIAAAGSDDGAHWDEWLATIDALGGEIDFNYLRSRFASFRECAELVGLIRQSALESESNRRSTSRFIFPFGVDALYSDAIYHEKSGTIAADFSNFGRTGELLYMMVSRAARGRELKPHFARFFNPERSKNRLVGRLCAPGDDRRDRAQKGETFLPYRTHPAFNRLVEDWLAIFELELPEQDAFAHLVPLGALHVVLYQLETAAAIAGRDRPKLICEVIAPRREFVRQRSIMSYQDNDSLTLRALERSIDDFESAAEWTGLLAMDLSDAERADRAAELVEGRFHFRDGEGTGTSGTSPHDLIANLRREVEDKHEQGAGKVHANYLRYIGLASARATNRTRYAPSDTFLKTLVLARVKRRLELKRFLSDLDEHYGLIFGEAEARLAIDSGQFDSSAFEKNRGRLEARLASMGLLQRLSDGCAYVINPFASED